MRDKLTHAYSEVERGNGGNGETSEVHPSSSISSTFCSNCGAKMRVGTFCTKCGKKQN